MTTRKHLKRLVRSRVARTGEPYATALRKVRDRQESPMAPDTAARAASTIEGSVATCSFCFKGSTEVQRMVAGPGVAICDECVALAAWVVEEAGQASVEEAAARRAALRHPSTAELLATLAPLVRGAERAEAELAASVSKLRARGTDWPAIAEAAGMTAGAARHRFGAAAGE